MRSISRGRSVRQPSSSGSILRRWRRQRWLIRHWLAIARAPWHASEFSPVAPTRPGKTCVNNGSTQIWAFVWDAISRRKFHSLCATITGARFCFSAWWSGAHLAHVTLFHLTLPISWLTLSTSRPRPTASCRTRPWRQWCPTSPLWWHINIWWVRLARHATIRSRQPR